VVSSFRLRKSPRFFEKIPDILLKQLSPTKVARLLVAWQIGRGDYLTIREQLFGDETVNTLFEKIQVYQSEREAQEGDER